MICAAIPVKSVSVISIEPVWSTSILARVVVDLSGAEITPHCLDVLARIDDRRGTLAFERAPLSDDWLALRRADDRANRIDAAYPLLAVTCIELWSRRLRST